MSRPVRVDALTVGRCFYAPPPEESWEGAPKATLGNPLARPDCLFRIDGSDTDGVAAVSATGEARVFPGATPVYEVPRAGYDRLRASRP